MVSSNPYKPLYYDKPPLRSHTEPFCRRLSPTKSFGLMRGGFLIFRENLQPGNRPAILHTMHLENCISRLDLDTAPRPRTNAGEPNNAAATQGQERRFGANGDHRDLHSFPTRRSSDLPLTHINHFTVINRRSAATPNHFAAACPRQNPLVPCGAVFFISRENLQPGTRPAILHTAHLESHISRLNLDTAP